MNVEAFLMIASTGGMISAVISGAMVGGTYGYMLSHEAPPRYPTSLWLVGLFFIAGQAAFGIIFNASPFPAELGAARAVLWTTFCGTIPMGRWGRYRVELAYVRRKRRKVQ